MAQKKEKAKTPRKRPAPKALPNVAGELAEKSQTKSARQAETPVPEVGDRVTIRSSKIGTEFLVAQVGEGSATLNIPGTNFNRYNIPFSDLNFVEKVPRAAPQPVRPAFNAEQIHERIENVHHKAMDELRGELAILKKYLQSKHLPAKTTEYIEAFCDAQEEAWQTLAAKISNLLEH